MTTRFFPAIDFISISFCYRCKILLPQALRTAALRGMVYRGAFRGSLEGACPASTHLSGGEVSFSYEGQEGCLPLNRPLFTSCFGFLQPQLVLGGAAQTASLGTATAVQTGTPQRTVPGATTTSTAATVSAALPRRSPPPGQLSPPPAGQERSSRRLVHMWPHAVASFPPRAPGTA